MGDIDLKVFYAAENSNKFPKTKLWKEKSVEDAVTHGPIAHATLIVIKIEFKIIIEYLYFN